MMKLPRSEKLQLVARLQEYFQEQGWEQIGNLEAEGLLDFFILEAGPYMYNAAVQDAQRLVTEHMQRIEEELYSLEKQIRR